METELFEACLSGNTSAAVEKISSVGGALNLEWKNPEQENMTLIQVASKLGQVDVVTALLQVEGLDVNVQGKKKGGATPLFLAAKGNFPQVVTLLLQDPRTEVNQGQKSGPSPFYIACEGGHVEVVKVLLGDQRVVVNPESNSSGALHAAAERGHEDVVRLLVAHPNLEVNGKTPKGFTPLLLASFKGSLGVVKVLLADSRVLVNEANKFGVTPICAASGQGHLEVVKCLAGDPRVKVEEASLSGDSPLDKAWGNNRADVAAFLQKIRVEKLQITPEMDVQFVEKSLVVGSPDVLRAISTLIRLHQDPETLALALKAQFLPRLIDHFVTYPQEREMIMWGFEKLVKFDALRAELQKYAWLSRISLTFANSSAEDRNLLLVPLQNILFLAKDQRNMFAEGSPKIVEILHSSLQEETEEGLISAGIVLMLADLLSDRRAVVKAAMERVMNAIMGSDSDLRNIALDSLSSAAAMSENRPILLSLKVMDQLQRFVDDPKLGPHFLASVIQALLSASDVSATSETGIKPASLPVITRIVESLNTFATTNDLNIATTHGYTVSCSVILIAARSLATNEANIVELKKQGLVPILIALLKARLKDLFLTSFDELEEVSYILWSLSFDKECNRDLVAGGVVGILKGVPRTHPGVRRGVEGALWMLDESSRPRKATQNQELVPHKQVMISYSWAQKIQMRELGSYLGQVGFSVWLDIDQMEGSVLGKMAEGIENSSVVVIGLSAAYMGSQACRTEAEYAYQLKKNVVFIKPDVSYNPKGWLGALLGAQLWYAPWTFPSGFEDGVAPVVQTIEHRLAHKDQPAAEESLETLTLGQHDPNASWLNLINKLYDKVNSLTSHVEILERRLQFLEKAAK